MEALTRLATRPGPAPVGKAHSLHRPPLGLSLNKGPCRGTITLHGGHRDPHKCLWEQELVTVSPCSLYGHRGDLSWTPGRSELGKLMPREEKGLPEVTHSVGVRPPASFSSASGP